MKIILEPTDRIVTVNGIPMRLWRGVTGKGIKVEAIIPRIAASAHDDVSELSAELKETLAPVTDHSAFPLRMIL